MLTALTGCPLLQMDKSKTTADFFTTVENTHEIPKTNVSTIDLEVVTLHRPVGDPLLGDELWDEVDEITALIDVDMQKSLSENGIRVGVVGNSYPRALEEILGLTTREKSAFDEEEDELSVRKFTVRSGGEAEVVCSLAKRIEGIRIPMMDGVKEQDFPENTHCILRVNPRSVQDGWIRMEVQPEIHHGEKTLRPTGHSTGWDQKVSQKIMPIFSQKFEVEMNVGEMVLITSVGDQANSLGQHFFRSEQESGDMQRLILIRFANMSNDNAVIKAARVVK